MEIDTTNKFIVGALGDKIVIINGPMVMKPFSKTDALLLAAYLVLLADDNDEFNKIKDACANA